MKREEIIKCFPFLENCEEYDTEKIKYFDDHLEIVKSLFPFPKFLKGIDWLPAYKREDKNNEIDYIELRKKEPVCYWQEKNEIIIVYYDAEKDLYYEMLYRKEKKEMLLEAILVLEDKLEGANA